MMQVNEVESKVPLTNIVPDDGYQYFFGYYDLQPFDKANKRHLTHRVTFIDRIPEPGDVAEVGYITLEDKVFHKVSQTNAWNFQQGALLQWFDEEHIIFNDFRDGDYCSVIANVETGAERLLCAPLAHLSADRKWGLSINFPRVWNFRPGYGYCNTVDPYFNVDAPEDDGIFLVDVEQNTSKLIMSYRQLAELFPEEPYCNMKLVVNHITFNPSASRFLFLLRNFPKPKSRWGTILVTADRDGSNAHKLTNYEVNSHYHWKDDRHIMIWSALPNFNGEYGIFHFDDVTCQRQRMDDELVNAHDIHCLYSPDRTCFVGDDYPRNDFTRRILCYDFETKRSGKILSLFSDERGNTDIRCDLHNRFSPDGKLVSFDTNYTGRREILVFPFDKETVFA